MNKDTGKHFVLDDSCVNEINELLVRYQKCSDRHDSIECLDRKGGCDGCELFMTHDEDDAAWELTEAFRKCIEMGFLRRGKDMNTIKMEDVPREVWDEVYEKWSDRLEVGWIPSMWCGCGLCTWMAYELVVGRMREVDCELCPLWDGEWCRSLPEDSKIHPEYCNDGLLDVEPWEDRVKEFLEFIKPYCSREGKDDLRDDVLEYIRKNSGLYDVVGVARHFDSHDRSEVYSVMYDLVDDGLVEVNTDKKHIHSLCAVYE